MNAIDIYRLTEFLLNIECFPDDCQVTLFIVLSGAYLKKGRPLHVGLDTLICRCECRRGTAQCMRYMYNTEQKICVRNIIWKQHTLAACQIQ